MIADPIPSVEVAGRVLPTPISWTLSTDLLQPCDALEVELPLFVHAEDIATDAAIKFRMGSVQVFAGRVDERLYTTSHTWTVRARDNCARLVDESVPGAGWRIGTGSLQAEILRIVSPWFDAVSFSNASDRVLRRGSGRGLARAAREPVTASQLRAIGRYVDAGMTRWAALQRILVPLGLLAWSSADGRTLIVARPNYSQAVQYRFVMTPTASNVLNLSYQRSVAERYAEVVVSGSAVAPGAIRAQPSATPGIKRPKRVVNRSLGVARDTSGDFLAEKRLFVVDTSIYPKEAQARAERLLGQQTTRAEAIQVTAPGLGQTTAPGAFVLYAPDCLAAVRLDTAIDSNTDISTRVVDGVHYVTKVDFHAGPDGATAQMSLVPKGAILV